MNPKKEIETGWMKAGTKCWVYDQERSLYLKARIADTKSRAVFSNVPCELEDKSRQDFKPTQIQRRNESSAIVSNLVDLEFINDAEILYQLEERFRQRNIFTFIGSNLLVINPYELIPANYDNKMIDRYHDDIFRKHINFKDVEPHIYGLVGEVFKEIGGSQLDQAIVISGESGSGKTETNKYCLKYLTHVCGIMQGRRSNMEEKIMSCNPLLEAFGNAKTVKNDNSSRFGKLTTLRINKRTFQISESSIRSYFLEKSRLPFQNTGQMNFHIFYYFVKGLPSEEAGKYYLKNSKGHLLTTESFRCINTKQPQKTTAADQDAFHEVRHSFNLLKFSLEQQEQIWSILSGILHLSNVDFDHAHYEESKTAGEVVDKESFAYACKLLGLNASKLEKCMLYRSRNILKEITLNPEPQVSCRSTRDSMMKTLYENLFQWLIATLNLTLKDQHVGAPNDQFVSLRLLDIYGFEVFQTNGFEQLCVNYTNERLHQLYIEQVFKQEKKIFEEEGLGKELENITFSDNRRIIQLLDTEANSVFNLLDESCSVKVDNLGLLNNIRKLTEKNADVFPEANKRMNRNAFIVKHTPGEIEYAIEGFRERNIDEIREDLLLELAASEMPLVRQIFEPYKQRLGKGSESKKRFLGRKIRDEIGSLITELQTGTDVHFIRCIKPNEEKKPFTFIRYLGLLDTILLRKATYHVRVPYERFHEMYSSIEFPKDDKEKYQSMPLEDRREATRVLFRKYFPDTAIERLFGVTRIFMKEGSKPIIDKIYESRMRKVQQNVQTIMQYARGKIQSGQADLDIGRYKMGLRIFRYLKNFVYVAQREEAIRTIEDFFVYDVRLVLARLKQQRIEALQNYFRRIHQTTKAERRKRNIRVLETYLHNLSECCFTNKFLELNQLLRTKILDMVWERYRRMKLSKIERYLSGLKVRAANVQLLVKAEEKTKRVLDLKFKRTLRTYLKAFATRAYAEKKLRAVLLIQSYQRMRVIRSAYRSKLLGAIRIQQAWRAYQQNRADNIRMIEDLFRENESRRQYTQLLCNEVLHKPLEEPDGRLHRQAESVEAVLHEHSQVKTSKIGLFYYILDLQPLVDIEDIYSGNSWISNYYSLFRDGLLKHNNPLQYLEVGEFHTLAATCTKLYSWGWNDHEQLGVEDIRVANSHINSVGLPPGSKLRSFYADSSFSCLDLEEPPLVQFFGQVPEDVLTMKQHVYRNIRARYTLNAGNLVELQPTEIIPLGLPEKDKVMQVACGMSHVICRTSLKRVMSWGDGGDGQLGHGDYLSHRHPKPVDFFVGDKHHVVQVAAAAKCSLVVYENHRVWWCGSNGTIRRCSTPTEVQVHHKSDYLWDSSKYTPIRVVASWSKSLSVVGVTFAWHNGVLPTNISLKKKVLQQLALKWNEQGITTVLPPYIRSLTHYFAEKCMRLPVYRPDIQMESRKKLNEFRSSILQQLKSVKVAERSPQPLDRSSQDPF